ncbi:radical SAM protein [Candidatus Omnitrophota bacterium]
MSVFLPGYLRLSRKDLVSIKDELIGSLGQCRICPRNCGVDRLKEERGYCKTGRLSPVSSANLHFGEEPELVGTAGSGTIFFSFCNLGCIYCQNHTLSHLGEGTIASASLLAGMMLSLQNLGAHNINFVTPSHVLPQIIEALCAARDKGLCLPLVYNSGGYDSAEVLRRLSGIFDIYMPDVKYSDDALAEKYSQAPGYWGFCQEALLEMHRQVGDLVCDRSGIAQRGLLIRHLVLPGGLAGSGTIIDFITARISKDTYLNIMDQYRPCHKAYAHPELMRRITQDEYNEVIAYALEKGLQRGFKA